MSVMNIHNVKLKPGAFFIKQFDFVITKVTSTNSHKQICLIATEKGETLLS